MLGSFPVPGGGLDVVLWHAVSLFIGLPNAELRVGVPFLSRPDAPFESCFLLLLHDPSWSVHHSAVQLSIDGSVLAPRSHPIPSGLDVVTQSARRSISLPQS